MKIKINYLAFILLSILSQPTLAAFILDGTRFIYDEEKENISIDITNQSKFMYGSQVWVENISSPKSDVSFIPMPSFSKINGGDSQVVRIARVSNDQPKNRESIYWLNIQEIPSANKNPNNSMVIAIHTKVKLIYRPDVLRNGRKDAELKMRLIDENGVTFLENTTPYYFSISSLKLNDVDIESTQEVSESLSIFKPFSKVKLEGVTLQPSSKLTFESIDDFGAFNEYSIY
ncbi:fimbria/pilus periplasmic chaperone [Vibrio splendidus]|uniref:fimbria/pilus periplasmic chaperone n=1 Tax=Vibrio splendidus TaxID=29497 RepID=UPI000AF5DEEF|nr:fimbria/pilus periplasmic chaperone [Vibrio splendidus]PHX03498.1 Chaperone protein FaeE precursor [Vibrio splendidus]